MAKLQAQLSYFGAIDNAVCNNPTAETIEFVEKLLPGATRPGRRAWYGELQRYLNKNRAILQPKVAAGEYDPEVAAPRQPETEIRFPSLADAVTSVAGTPTLIDPITPVLPTIPGLAGGFSVPEAEPEQLSAPVTAKLLFASTVISGIAQIEGPGIFGTDAEKLFDRGQGTNPLTMLLERTSNADRDTCAGIAEDLIRSESRADYANRLNGSATAGWVDAVVASAPAPCTGVLRRAGGQYFSVLTTNWPNPEVTLDEMLATIEPRNWPLLYNFFRRMVTPQPRTANGWTRLLEVVSPDPTQWELRTSLKFWKAQTAGGGICINYDLDDVRDPEDSGLVEVDSGFIWVSALDPDHPEAGVRIRTSKALRIRGLSPIATSAIGCYTGWSDVGAQLLTAHAKEPPHGCIPFMPYSPDSDDDSPVETPTGAAPADPNPAGRAEAAAEALDLPTGWRESLISNSRKQVEDNISTFADLAKKTAGAWDGGLDEQDIHDLGTQWGSTLTRRATDMFTTVMNSMRPAADDSEPKVEP
jgi:hypothetical protein